MKYLFFKSAAVLIVLVITVLTSYAQKNIATLEVTLDRETGGLSIPVSYNLDELTKLSDGKIALFDGDGKDAKQIAFQVEETASGRTIHWMVEHNGKGTRVYALRKGKGSPKADASVALEDKDESLIFLSGNQDLLTFKYGIQNLPEAYFNSRNASEDGAKWYARGGFIHPLKSPTGQVLTRIQAPDHWHHYGLWNPWTHAHVEGSGDKVIDFWNIGTEKNGTMRVDGQRVVAEGPVFGEIKANLSAVVLNPDHSIKTDALGEEQTMRVYAPQNKKSYIFDFTTAQTPRVPFTVIAYRYQGLGMRATPEWHAENSEMITSEGVTVRSRINGTRARWCIVQGMTGNDYAGVLFMSSPENRSHPEPMRVWSETDGNSMRETGKPGAVFFNFNPAMENIVPDWKMEVGQTYTLKYRMLVYTGKLTPEMAESAWQYFANPPKVVAKK